MNEYISQNRTHFLNLVTALQYFVSFSETTLSKYFIIFAVKVKGLQATYVITLNLFAGERSPYATPQSKKPAVECKPKKSNQPNSRRQFEKHPAKGERTLK